MNIEGDDKQKPGGHIGNPGPGGNAVTTAHLKDAEDIVCEECKCNVFQETIMLKKVSKFLTGSDKDSISPLPVISCAKCQHVNKMFIPQL